MLKKQLIIFIILFFSIFCFCPTVHASVFGNDGLNSSNMNENTSQKDIINEAKQSGNDAKKNVAKFKNPEQLNKALDSLFSMIRWSIASITSFGTITSFLIFSISFFRLSTVPSHPIERRKVFIDILQSGISTVLLGGLSLILTVFYKTFMTFINSLVFLSTDYKLSFALALIEYKFLICGIMGILSLSLFIVFIKDVISLSTGAASPQQRSQAIKGLLTTIIAIIGFGGTGIFVAIFNGLL